MQIGICSTLDNADDLKAAGVDYIELGVQNFLVPLDSDEAFDANRRAADAAGLPPRACNGFLPRHLRTTGDNADHDGICRYAESACRRAAQVGIEHIVYGSGGSRQIDDGFDPQLAYDQFAAVLKRLGPIAGEFGVTIVIEPLRRQECNLINTVAQGAELTRAVDHPHIRLLADFYHMLQNGEDPASMAADAPLIHHLHVAEKADRTPPGVDGDDFSAFFAALTTSPAKRISVEGGWPNGIAADGPRAVEVLRGLVAGG